MMISSGGVQTRNITGYKVKLALDGGERNEKKIKHNVEMQRQKKHKSYAKLPAQID